jgi:hypothetical protein
LKGTFAAGRGDGLVFVCVKHGTPLQARGSIAQDWCGRCDWLYALFFDAMAVTAGRLWAGIDNTLSIYQGGKFRQIRRQDGGPVGVVMGMTGDSENNIWAETIGPPETLIRIQNLKVREEFPAPRMLLARKIAADPQSGIWVGLVNGDLARYRSGKTEIVPFTHHPDSRVGDRSRSQAIGKDALCCPKFSL